MAIAVGATVPAWAHGITERVSLGPGGAQSDSNSFDSAISADGRFVAFVSHDGNLVPGDTNREGDVFVRDRKLGTTRRVSLGPGGVQANDFSNHPAISVDGRFVAFGSDASNLVPGDTNVATDVFVRDRETGTTRRVNLGPGGAQGNGSLLFGSLQLAISADGRFVAFDSDASNLVPGDTNGSDVFVRDRKLGITERVNLGPGGVQGDRASIYAAISADGRFVAFGSWDTNLVPGDTNDMFDLFVRDRKLCTTERVNLGPGGVQLGSSTSELPNLSADGRFVGFVSDATDLVRGDTNGVYDVFVRDRQTGRTGRVSLGRSGVQSNGPSYEGRPALSADGRFVAFTSEATNLVRGDTNEVLDVFVRDRKLGTTRRVSVSSGGVQGNGHSLGPSISADGRLIAFESEATNLVPGDTNDMPDVFVRILTP